MQERAAIMMLRDRLHSDNVDLHEAGSAGGAAARHDSSTRVSGRGREGSLTFPRR